MRLLKIIYFEIKQLYSKWFIIIWLAMATYNIAIAALLIKHNAETVLNGVFYELNSFILVLLMASLMASIRSFLVKSTIDFVFTTQVNPVEYYIARAIANGLIYLITFAVFTAPFIRLGIDAAYYVLILLLLTSFFTLFTANARVLPQTLRLLYTSLLSLIIILGFISPRLSPIYGLIYPSPTYAVYALALTAIAVATIPRRQIRDLASNAYEVLGVPMPLPHKGNAAMPVTHLPRNPWGVIWFTSTKVLITRGERTNILKVLVPVSTAAAIVYLINAFFSGAFTKFIATPHQFIKWQGIITAMIFTFIFIYIYSFILLMATISGEKLWLSLSIDPARYFRLRMLARTLIMAITLLPWVIAYTVQGIYFRPTIYLALALIAIILITPSLSWLLAAYVKIPQVRELDITQRPMVFTLKWSLVFILLLASLGIFMAPYFLALEAEITHYGLLSMILNYVSNAFAVLLIMVSIAFFYLVVLSEKGRGVWSWLVNKLSEDGYV